MTDAFPPGTVDFLAELREHNTAEWFDAHRSRYQRDVVAPAKELVTALGPALHRLAPGIRAEPRVLGSIFRINRDTRFSADKRPYKQHVGAWWVRSGLEKTSGAGFYFHIGAKEVVVAAGAYMATPEQLLAIRRHIEANYQQARKLLDDRKLRALMQEWEGEPMKRVPKGFPQDSPAAELLKCRRWGLSATLPAALATEPKLVKEVARRFQAAAPLVSFLNQPILPVRKPLL